MRCSLWSELRCVSTSNRSSDKWLDYSWNILEIFLKLLQVLATQFMNPGNTVGNGSRVFWKNHHTHKSTNNVELCYSKSDPWTGSLFKLQTSWFAPDPLNQNMRLNKIFLIPSSWTKLWLRASYYICPDACHLTVFCHLRFERVS